MAAHTAHRRCVARSDHSDTALVVAMIYDCFVRFIRPVQRALLFLQLASKLEQSASQFCLLLSFPLLCLCVIEFANSHGDCY